MTPLRRAAHVPRVSVIIASYRWPEALRTTLATALGQTIEDVEVLVVEDGADRASRGVVRGARDPRARWTALRRASGSQAGPNRHGLRAARAPIVAYLGHDDVWHPEHLARALAALGSDVDIVHTIALYLGAGEDRRLLLAGGAPWEPSAFVPPSSVVHWRQSPRIGDWIAPDRSGMPVDYAFLMACHARGARFAAAATPTVFKYPAGWRLDSYRSRDASPQRRLAERLRAEPQLGELLLRDAVSAGAPRVMAAPPPAPPGVIQDHMRRLKGLPARFGPRVTRWTPDAVLAFPGWHSPERDGGGSFAWTGPVPRAFVRLDAPGRSELGVRVTVRHVLTAGHLDGLVVDLDGEVVTLTRGAAQNAVAVMTGWLSRPAREPTVEVGLTSPVAAATAVFPGSEDQRALGVAVSEIELLQRRR